MSTTKVGQTISRLAVVAKDFSTYYIPGTTFIVDKQVNFIDETADEFVLWDSEGNVIGRISKKTPYIADYTDIHEVSVLDLIDEGAEEALVSFGNFLLKHYNLDGKEVTHADLENWKIEIGPDSPQDN